MDDAQTRLLRLLRADLSFFAANVLKIKTKAGGLPQPMKLNRAQGYIHAALEQQKAKTGMVRAIILKGRQMGCSTYVQARFYHRASMNYGVRAYILTHEAAATRNLFAMADGFYRESPERLRPELGVSNANAMTFERLGSGYAVATAGSKDTGRSGTAQLMHGCLAEGSLVVGCDGGLVPIERFAVGDRVKTHRGADAAISYISEQTKPCVEFKVRGLGVPLVCSHEHRFWTPGGWRRADQLAVGDVIGYPVANPSNEITMLPFAIPLAQRVQGGGQEHRPPATIAVDRDLGLVLGLYLAEGCVKRQHQTGALSGLVFTMHEREVERNRAWIEALKRFFPSLVARARKDSKAATIDVYGRALATRVVEWCGERDGKRLPLWWRQAGRGFVEGLVVGYLLGDGHFRPRRDRRIRATSIRSAITIGMRDAIASLGYGWAGVTRKPAGIRRGRNEREAWILSLCGSGVDRLSDLCGRRAPPRRRTSSVGNAVSGGYAWSAITGVRDAGERKVYDFEVDHDDHSYCILHAATHNSEVAFWDNAPSHMAGIGQIVPSEPGTEVILESTGNGVGNVFHETWQMAESGKSLYLPIFTPWWWSDEYRLQPPLQWEFPAEDYEYGQMHGLTPDQLYWRRMKINTDFSGNEVWFQQEYPANAQEAFVQVDHDALIAPELIMKARKAKAEPYGATLMGVDPARFGDDRTAIVVRRGRVVQKVDALSGRSTMEVAGVVASMLKSTYIDRCFVDVVGIGAGVYDRLRELGFENVTPVGGGERADEPRQFINKRAEMWWRMREWFTDGPVAIPDMDELHADLVNPRYTRDSNQRLKIESKEDMKKRQIRSPDLADALALTFAYNVFSNDTELAEARSGSPQRIQRRGFDWRAR